MELPAAIAASPARVAAQDRAGWLALFSADAVIEDPVGAARYHARDLPGFYDTFIAGHEIAFEVEQDAGEGRDVWRDVTILTRLSTGVELRVPAFVHYRLSGDDRIAELSAYWELRRMVGQVLGAGLRGLWTMTLISTRMLRHLGVRALWGFARALLRGRFDDHVARATLGSALVLEKRVSAGSDLVCRFRAPSGWRGVARIRFGRSHRVEDACLYLRERTE